MNAATTDEDGFVLEIQITTDVETDSAVKGCDTSDGCAPTCASSCVSD